MLLLLLLLLLLAIVCFLGPNGKGAGRHCNPKVPGLNLPLVKIVLLCPKSNSPTLCKYSQSCIMWIPRCYPIQPGGWGGGGGAKLHALISNVNNNFCNVEATPATL